jgi:hypothetical protein
LSPVSIVRVVVVPVVQAILIVALTVNGVVLLTCTGSYAPKLSVVVVRTQFGAIEPLIVTGGLDVARASSAGMRKTNVALSAPPHHPSRYLHWGGDG